MDSKHPLDDFLAGLTPRCPGFGSECGARVPTKDSALCVVCMSDKNQDDFKNEFADRHKMKEKGQGEWYMKWEFLTFNGTRYPSFVCLTCGDRIYQASFGVEREGEIVPAAACCVNPSCKTATNFWGPHVMEVRSMVADYVRDIRCSGGEPKKPLI